MAQETLTIDGNNVTINYKTSLTEAEVQDVRDGKEDLIKGASIVTDLPDSSNFQEVLEWIRPVGDMMRGDNITFFNWYYKLPNGEIKHKGTQHRGLKVAEFVQFANLVSPFSFIETYAKNSINLMLNWKYGSKEQEYTVHCFDLATLQFFQPIIFDVTQSINNGNTNITVLVTDGTGPYEYSLTNSNYQSSNVLTVASDTGEQYIYVKDSTGRVNSKKIQVLNDII